jgi:prephenate dehydrogenase
MPWEKVTLVGVGLLGGSLGRALRARKLANSVVGLVRREATLAEAAACRAVDHATLNPEEAVNGADLVVLCTPLEAMPRIATRILPFIGEDVLLTDVGSVKQVVTREMESVLSNHSAVFVGSHPMAGGEKSGVAHSSEDLFEKAICAVTPIKSTPREAVGRIDALWKSVGAKTLEMDPKTHDHLVSRTSHLPHVLSSLLASYVLDPEANPFQKSLCASGFRDTTRIAEGDVTMWRDILTQNNQQVVETLDEYLDELKGFRDLLAANDHESITSILKLASDRRKNWTS